MFELFSNRTRPSSLSRSAPNRWGLGPAAAGAGDPGADGLRGLADEPALRRGRGTADLAGSGLPAVLPAAHHPAHVHGAGVLAAVQLRLAAIAAKYRTAEKPWSRCWTSCNRCPSWVSGHRHRALHRAVPRQPAGRGMRRHLRHLHLAGLEHGVQPVPIHAHGAARAARGGARVPAVGLAAFLAASCPMPRRACCGT